VILERAVQPRFRTAEPFLLLDSSGLYLELEQARLYALRADADLVYGFVPETNLAGEYVANRCY